MIILTSPGEIAFRVFGFPIYYYGLCMGLAMVCGFLLSYFIERKIEKKFYADILFDITSVSVISGIIFARLYYCFLNFSYYSANISEIFNLRAGGLSIHGAIIGGIIVTSAYCYFKKYPILQVADVYAYGLILAQAIGRWGNFFNSEAYGLPSYHFIAQFIPEAARISGYEFYKYFHPAFLYESILDLFILLILFFVIRGYKNRFDGFIFASYLILYSIVRFFIEGLRLDSIVNVGALHVPQLVSLVIILMSLIFIFVMKQRNKNQINL